MSRARATALALVNWKGVFYERYQLDRHVTALEGANGAGKTTVMIAAYVVLLPDMSRLRFTNLGETGATGGDKGVWGRLGAPSRPSYAALEIALAGGERLVAGVQLQRKAEPALDLVPFLVTGLAPDGRLRDLLLLGDGADESVPTLDELRTQVARAGARIEVFASAKDYFAALFDRGVTPLRMGTDEERNKLNEMLRTSMTGGISRALTSDLRAFLLKEETGLGDALSHMRANLDACRRTRIEVSESRRLERELAGVYDAGQAMTTAALLAARTRAEEHATRADAAETAHDEARRTAGAHRDAAGDARARHEDLATRLAATRTAHQDAVARVERAHRGQALIDRMHALAPELAHAREAADAARVRQRDATLAREARRGARDEAALDGDRAARGLADLQSGVEDLHRNVEAHRRAVRRLDEAREALGEAVIDDLEAMLARTRAAIDAIDGRRMRADRDLASERARRVEHADALAALASIAGATDPARAHEQARAILAGTADLEALEARLPELAAERDRAAVLATRQATAHVRAAALGLATRLDDPSGHVALHLAEVEAAFTEAEDQRRAAEAQAESARRHRDALRKEARELEHAASRWRIVDGAAGRLEAALGEPVRTREAVAGARARLARDLEAARERVQDARRRREARLEQAAGLASPSVAVHPDLLRLRDELDAELLASRYEDVDVADAARVQAELGPLVDALVVEDPAAAVRKLANLDRDVASVWIVGPDGGATVAAASSGPTEEPAERAASARDLVVREGGVTRVTRLPASPTLGRRARERRAHDLRAQADALAAELDEALAAQRRVEVFAEDADRLLEEGRALDAGDPVAAIAASEVARADADRAERAALEAAREARVRGLAARTRAEALRALLADAFLLEPVDQAARAQELAASLRLATEARAELARTATARRTLARLLDALRDPPAEDSAAALATARSALDEERGRLFRAREALEDVVRNREALALGHLETALAERGAVAPALEAQLASARAVMKAREDALRTAEGTWDEATAIAQKAAAAREAIEAQVARIEGELAEERLGDAPPAAEARDAASRLAAERASLEAQERASATEAALAAERLAQAERAAAQAADRLVAERRASEPAAARWVDVRDHAASAGVLDEALAARGADAYEGRGSEALVAEARSREEVLIDRLLASPGGADCASRLRDARSDGAAAEHFLDAWLAARDWIQRRLPAPLGEMPEPLQALGRLRRELEALEERLVRQDRDLRGNSEDVARGIDVQLRRAAHQVRRLNQHLEGIRFGSITGIRVQMRRIDRMEQVLGALREGAAQELLFQPNLPIEDALDEIFRRYGGGRGGSARVLDYREYAELGVEVRRHDRGEWEPASPARLSTGEAIGVGAALMMVILTEWERDANLLRAKRATGSLRFLFLDEANRLSQDNLAVLFDLCRTLDLQLLIAAPEVAHADWNTTYRLVRRVAADGQEEVLVSGRRTVPAVPEA